MRWNVTADELRAWRGVARPSLTEEKSSRFTREAHDVELLYECQQHWSNLHEFRTRRRRAMRYVRGDQWSDTITDPKTNDTITEGDYIKQQGKLPLKQNQIRQLLKNLVGQYRSNPTQSMVITRRREDASTAEMFTNALECVSNLNKLKTIDARNFEEFACSGAAFYKVSYDYWRERNIEDVLITSPKPDRMFYNTDLEDVRYKDIRIVGELIDVDIEEIIRSFAKNAQDEAFLRSIYNPQTYALQTNQLSAKVRAGINFTTPTNGKCRLIEVWYLKGAWRTYVHDPVDGSYSVTDESVQAVEARNAERVAMAVELGMDASEVPLMQATPIFERKWHVKYLTPTGYCLLSSETPYEHEEHPYTMLLYPLIDGEVWGWVEDIIDQQRYINRLMTLLDFIISASAKGVLMVHKESIPADSSPEEFADNWSEFNGVIVYTGKPGVPAPQQVSANSTNIGVGELLSVQMKLIQEISGVQGASQGIQPTAGTPTSRYAMEAQNASTNTIDLMQTFAEFKRDRDLKVLKTIQQFYDKPRHLAISGKVTAEDSRIYNPERAKSTEVDLVVSQSTDTPAFRQQADDLLMEMVKGQMISTKLFLEHCSWPFADKLLDAMNKEAQANPADALAGLNPADAQAMLNANPKAQAMMGQAIEKPVAA